MSDYVPTTEEVRDSLVYLNKYRARQFVGVDLLVVGSETAAQFDRMIAEVERAAAEKALLEAADAHEAVAGKNSFGGAWLRARAEAYRQERRRTMSENEPCPYGGPAHDFEPLRIESVMIWAICRKCGEGLKR